MKEKWTEIIRRKLEGHRMPPPDGLWEGISEQMGFQPETTHRRIGGTRWRWAAAAAILVLGGFFAFYLNDSQQPFSPIAKSAMESEEMSLTETDMPQPETATTEPSTTPTVSSALAAAHVSNTPTIQDESVPEPKKQAIKDPDRNETEEKAIEGNEMTGNEIDRNEMNQPVIAQASEPKTESPKEDTPPSVADNRKEEMPNSNYTPSYPFEQVSRHSSKQGKWTMGLHTSGGLLAANTSTNKVENTYYLMDANSYSEKSLSKFVCAKFETYQSSKHHLPVRFGINLNHQLNDRLALLSGINYTWLYSEFNNGFSKTDQHLHYLGIPVGVAYQLWSNHHIQFYLSGSVMLEKCLNDKPWQWSVDAGAGAEYMLTKQLGLYLEPSVGYYFDDGTSVEHYYKEHPLAPNIMLGVRMHIDQ